MTIKGIIFDFDGLIIETEMPGCQAWAEVFARYGYLFTTEDWKKAIGTGPSAYDPAVHISQITRGALNADLIRQQTLQRTQELIEAQPILPGVAQWLQFARKAKIPLAVASSSDRKWVEGYLQKLEIRDFFTAVCTSDDVANVKPDPELYLLAASRIQVEPAECLALEDSPNGIQSAKSAGMMCIAVPNEITASMDLSLADKIVTSLSELNPEDLFTISQMRK